MNRQQIRCQSLTANNINAAAINGQAAATVGGAGALVVNNASTFDVSAVRTVILNTVADTPQFTATLDVSKPPPSGATITFIGYDDGTDAEWNGGIVQFSNTDVVFDNKGSKVLSLAIGANGCARVTYADVASGYWFVGYQGNNVTINNDN
jgi:hypothetical protein